MEEAGSVFFRGQGGRGTTAAVRLSLTRGIGRETEVASRRPARDEPHCLSLPSLWVAGFCLPSERPGAWVWRGEEWGSEVRGRGDEEGRPLRHLALEFHPGSLTSVG